MTQDTSQLESGETTGSGANAVAPEVQKLIDLIKADPARTAEELKSLREESKQRRLAAEASETKRKAEELARLEADQQWKAAAEELKRQLAEANAKAGRVDDTDAFLRSLVQRRVDSLLPHFRNLVPEYDDPRKTLEWLENNATALKLPATPANTGAGVTGDGGGAAAAKLSAEELALATMAGMTPEQWAKYKTRGKPYGAR